MRFTKRGRLIVLILIILGSIFTAGYLMNSASPSNGQTTYQHARHPPIEVYHAIDLTRVDAGKGCACVVSGTGSSTDPYVIAGWDIDASENDGIIIESVEYFTISQVTISGTRLHSAIRLVGVQNAKVSDSLINGTFAAISVYMSSGLVVVDNLVSNTEYGIMLEASISNIVARNTLRDVDQISIFVRGSDNVVEDNLLDGAYGGINVDGTRGAADRNIVTNNTISRAETYGIGLWMADRNTVSSNSITNGRDVGIYVSDSSTNNVIERNEVKNNAGDGVLIDAGSSDNVVQKNTVIGNGNGINTLIFTPNLQAMSGPTIPLSREVLRRLNEDSRAMSP